MTHSINLRMASLGASSAAFAALVMLALTATMTARLLAPLQLDPPAITIESEPPPVVPEAPTQPVRDPIQSTPDAQPLVGDHLASEATPVAAPSTPSAAPVGPPTIVDPHWIRRPDNLERYYPARARERGRQGEVVLNCLVNTEGALACVVATETPVGWGFGDAAIAIAREHRMAPATQDGRSVEGRYRMVVPFRLR
jgi:TonB family protein